MQVKPLGIGCYADFPVAGTNLVVAVTRTADVAYRVFVVTVTDGISRRVEGHTRTFSAVEYGSGYRDAADAYRQRLLDELSTTTPADVISVATFDGALAAEVEALSPAARRAIAAADRDGYIARRDVSNVRTLYSLRDQHHLGDLIYRGFTPLGLDLNGRGMQIAEYLNANRQHIAA